MAENKYSYFTEGEVDAEDLAREKRRKRRIRNKIIAFIVLLIVIGLIAGGIWYAVKYVPFDEILPGKSSTPEITEPIDVNESLTSTSEEDIETIIDELLSNEEEGEAQEEPELTSEEIFAQEIAQMVSNMTLEEKIAGMFIVTPESITGVDTAIIAGDGTKEALEKYPVGGIVYADKNIVSEEGFKEMVSNTRNFTKYKLFTCIYEGLGKDGVIASKLGLGATMSADDIVDGMNPYDAYMEEQTIAAYLNEYGINFTFGIDNLVSENMTNGTEEKEAVSDDEGLFGNDVTISGQILSQALAALEEGNIYTAVGKFPSNGLAPADTANEDYRSDYLKGEYEGTGAYLMKLSVEAGADAMVISHVTAAGFGCGEDLASCSATFINDYIRNELGFNDLIIITDRLDDKEITGKYTSAEVSVKAIKAGADMLMCPENFEEAYNALVDAVKNNEISEEQINASLIRIFKVKYKEMLETE